MISISEILYYVLIFPLQAILSFFLAYIHNNFISNWGSSIVALSILLNIFLLKIYLYTDKKAKEESKIKEKLDSRIKAWKNVYSKAKLFAFTQTLYRQNKYHPIYTLRALGGLTLQIPFFYAMYFVINSSSFLENESFLWIEDLSKPDSIFGINLLPILMTIFTLINVFLMSNKLSGRIQGIVISIIFFILLYNMPSGLVLYWTTNMLFYLCKDMINIILDRCNVKLGINKFIKSFKQKFYKFIFIPCDALNQVCYKRYRSIIIISICNLSIMIFLFSPIGIYVSDLSQFDFNYLYITPLILFGYFIFSCFIFSYIFSFIFKTNLLKLMALLFTSLVLISLVYTFILKGDYGSMSNFTFTKPPLRVDITAMDIIIDSIIVFLTVISSLWLIKWKYIINSNKIIFVTLSILTLFNLSSIFSYANGMPPSVLKSKISDDNYQSSLFNFSKNSKNILVVILDRADGYSMQEEFKNLPNLVDKYDGFINFKNAVSTSLSTLTTLPSIIGGEYYLAININNRNTTDNLKTKIAKAYASTINTFEENGYDVSAYLDFPTELKYLYPLLKNTNNIDFLSVLYDRQYIKNSMLRQPDITEKIFLNELVSFGIFRISLLSLRAASYQRGRWLFHSNKPIVSTVSQLWAFKENISNTQTKPTFKFFHFSITHNPYVLNANCDYIGQSVMSYNDENKYGLPYGHYYSEICAFKWLGEIVTKMKQLEVYDNTEIFITSDHGAQFSKLPIKQNFHIPLLYKPYNSRGKLRENYNLIANYNIASIFCENLPNGCPNVGKNVLNNNYPRKVLAVLTKDWRLEKQKKDKFILYKYYMLNNNNEDKNNYVVDIYNGSNWSEITSNFMDKE